MIEEQARPRRCVQRDGMNLLPLLVKLEAVLHHCFLVIVVACTDASELRQAVSCSFCCNVIDVGKVLRCSRADLAHQDVQGLIYSIPCLFAAQEAIERALDGLVGETRISRIHYSVIGNSPTATPSCRPI